MTVLKTFVYPRIPEQLLVRSNFPLRCLKNSCLSILVSLKQYMYLTYIVFLFQCLRSYIKDIHVLPRYLASKPAALFHSHQARPLQEIRLSVATLVFNKPNGLDCVLITQEPSVDLPHKWR